MLMYSRTTAMLICSSVVSHGAVSFMTCHSSMEPPGGCHGPKGGKRYAGNDRMSLRSSKRSDEPCVFEGRTGYDRIGGPDRPRHCTRGRSARVALRLYTGRTWPWR